MKMTRSQISPKPALRWFHALALSAALTGPGAWAAEQLTVVASGLNNPRGLAFGPQGSLYVAEAGVGAGDGHGGFGAGVGFTGSITEIQRPGSAHPLVRRVVTGLASVGTTERGPEVVGPDGISVHGRGGIYVIMAESSLGIQADHPGLDPAMAEQFGQLLKVTPSGQFKAVADVGTVNYLWTGAHANESWAPFDPPHVPQFPDSNPYGVLALPGRQYVVDAGANTLCEVRPNGSVHIIAYFPNPKFPAVSNGPPVIPISDAVPTCVAQGPDGWLYVGTLPFGATFARFGNAGHPDWASLPPQAKVYRVNPRSIRLLLDDRDVWASGLSPITACAFGPGGLYVAEFITEESHFASGDVVRIEVKSDGTAGARTKLGTGALQAPNGLALGPGGAVYVSNHSTSPGVGAPFGQVVRVNY